MKIGVVSLPVKDPIAAFKYYTEVLGFKEKLYMPEHYLAMVVSPEEPDSTSILLEPAASGILKTYQETVYEMGLPVIIFLVDDLPKEHERLKSLGVKFKKEPAKTQWGFDAIFEDTCGNYIQISEIEKK